MRFGVVTSSPSDTDTLLASGAPAGVSGVVAPPSQALDLLTAGDVAIGRLDVLATLDGIAEGLWCLGALAARGVAVLNPASCLIATHDKLLTARLLKRAGVPHPVTSWIAPRTKRVRWAGAAVVKPRHGSWGRDVVRCRGQSELEGELGRIRERDWFARHGALIQELVPPVGYDLRLVVVAGTVIGAVRRDAAPGEWRTNVALGATRTQIEHAPRDARELAIRAAHAVGGHLVGVDLIPAPDGSWVVLEVNGAVEFNAAYGADIHTRAATQLVDHARRRAEPDLLPATPGLPD